MAALEVAEDTKRSDDQFEGDRGMQRLIMLHAFIKKTIKAWRSIKNLFSKHEYLLAC